MNGELEDSESDNDDEFKSQMKKLKKARHEAQLKKHGKWPETASNLSSKQSKATIEDTNGNTYIGSYLKCMKPPRGDIQVSIVKVVSATELYIQTDEQVIVICL